MLNYRDKELLYEVAEHLRDNVEGVEAVGRGEYWKKYFLSLFLITLSYLLIIIPVAGFIFFIILLVNIYKGIFIPAMRSRAVDLGEGDIDTIDSMCRLWWISIFIPFVPVLFFIFYGFNLGFMRRNYLIVKRLKRGEFSDKEIEKALKKANKSRQTTYTIEGSPAVEYMDLRELKKLYEDGVITSEEFELKKRKILDI